MLETVLPKRGGHKARLKLPADQKGLPLRFRFHATRLNDSGAPPFLEIVSNHAESTSRVTATKCVTAPIRVKA